MTIFNQYQRTLQYLNSIISSKPVEFMPMIEEKTNPKKRTMLDPTRSGIKDYGGTIGLKRLETFLHYLGNPHHHLRILHVGGTSGKGSTCFMINQILSKAGYSVGMHISPHLISPLERIWINNKLVDTHDFIEGVKVLRSCLDEHLLDMKLGLPSYFEFILALTFYLFHQKKVDYCVIEVGMGGTLDGTNIIPSSLISIITNIGYDHMERLGKSQKEITRNKAGIIKAEGLVITGVQKPDLLSIIKEKAEQEKAVCLSLNKDFFGKQVQCTPYNSSFDFNSSWSNLKDIHIGMAGRYQVENAIMAVAAVSHLQTKKILNCPDRSIYEGLSSVVIPGRCEEFTYKNRRILLDGAHNPDKIQVLINHLKEVYRDTDILFILGFTRGKLLKEIPGIILSLANNIILTRPLINERQIEDIHFVYELFKKEKDPLSIQLKTDPFDALETAVEQSTPDSLIVVTGSLYLVGNIRSLWIDENYIIQNNRLW